MSPLQDWLVALIAVALAVAVAAKESSSSLSIDTEYARNVHVPAHNFLLSNQTQMQHGKDVKLYRKVLRDPNKWVAIKRFGGSGTDGEVIDAMEYFFWGSTDGVVLEMGAYDGVLHSQSLGFEKHFGWGRILIEGNPFIGMKLRRKNRNAITVNCAICEQTKIVHWYGTHEGIIETFPVSILEKSHPHIKGKLLNNGATLGANAQSLNTENVQWNARGIKDLFREVLCIPLNVVFSRLGLKRHINFFILDVEGGELSVLHTIDWTTTHVDVFVIETEPAHRPEGYKEAVTAFLLPHGFKEVFDVGRNTWYQHESFTPSRRPQLQKSMFKNHAFRKGRNILGADSNPNPGNLTSTESTTTPDADTVVTATTDAKSLSVSTLIKDYEASLLPVDPAEKTRAGGSKKKKKRRFRPSDFRTL